MKIASKYFLIDLKIDPRGKWGLFFIGLSLLFTLMSQYIDTYLNSLKMVTMMDLAYVMLGVGAVKCLQYVKIREKEIQFDKELKLRHEENKCPHCGESFTFTQDWNIHISECEYRPDKRSSIT